MRIAEKVLTHVGRDAAYVLIDDGEGGQLWVRWSAMVKDAHPRPDSWYPDGRVVTLAEWIEERSADPRHIDCYPPPLPGI